MKLAHLNIRSLFPKIGTLREYVLEQNFDVVAITETWLTGDIPSDLVCIPGYKFLRKDRCTRGGGVGIYIKNEIPFTVLQCTRSLEHCWIKIKFNNIDLVIGCIYRPPLSDFNDFCDEFESMLSSFIANNTQFLCMGDFNIDLFSQSLKTKRFLDIINTFDVSQLIDEPTRISQHSATLLDLILVSDANLISESGTNSQYALSDHELIYCKINEMNNTKKQNYQVKTFRDYKNFNYEKLKSDLQLIPWQNIYQIVDIDEKLKFLNDGLLKLQDTHIPLITKRFKNNPKPWITENIRLLQKLRDNALSRFKKTKKK